MLRLIALEFILKGVSGIILAALPLTAIKILGLPKSESAFWPRLLGVALIGLAVAIYMDATVRLGHGLGLAGALVINVATGLGLISMLVLDRGAGAWRGRLLLWLMAVALVALALVEVAFI